MKKKLIWLFVLVIFAAISMAGCGNKDEKDILSYCDEDIQTLFDGDELPMAVRHGRGGEFGYIQYETTDKQMIRAFMQAVRQIKVEEQTEGIAFDALDEIVFVMEDGQTYFICFNAWRLDNIDRNNKTETIYNLKNVSPLQDLCKKIDKDENMVKR